MKSKAKLLNQTKRKLKSYLKKTIFLLIGIAIVNSTQAQVTIGSGLTPQKGALLELKESQVNLSTINPDDPSTLEDSEKGVLYPRVSLKHAEQLTPLYGGVKKANGTWTDLSTATEKQLATGMMVYNINTDAVDIEGVGICVWNGKAWEKISPMGKAQFAEINCVDIIVKGDYVAGRSLDASHYLDVSLVVETIGSFSITAVPQEVAGQGNGYSFYMAGMALAKGPLTLKVPAQGSPVKERLDKLIVGGLNISNLSNCRPEINVKNAVSTYTINCANMSVKGAYVKGEPLNVFQHRIDVSVNVAKTGSYYISTPLINGIEFAASGVFVNKGNQTIQLMGSGKPTVNTDFEMTITTNTEEGHNTCKVTIPMTLPDMTFAIIGGTNVYTWGSPDRIKAIANASNGVFSPTGSVRVKSFTQLWQTSNTTNAADYLTWGDGGKYPDVLLFNAYTISSSTALASAISSYINRGGCVIFGSSDGDLAPVETLLRGIFGVPSSGNYASKQSGGVVEDDVYKIQSLPGSTIVNGPFGNLSDRHWGEDNATGGSIIIDLNKLPSHCVQICSAISQSKDQARNPMESIVWYSEEKNILYFGDSVGAGYVDWTGAYPAYYINGKPLSKLYGPTENKGSYQRFVYNASMELNGIAWAIRKAAASGINPH